MTRRHRPNWATAHRARRTRCSTAACEASGELDFTIEELVFAYPDAVFRTAEFAAADADLRFNDAVTVWRLPCGAFVWTPAGDSRIVASNGLVPLSDLWFTEADGGVDRAFGRWPNGPSEVMWRNAGCSAWERLT